MVELGVTLVALLVAAVIGGIALVLLFVLLGEGSERHEDIRRLQGGIKKVVLGRVPTKVDGLRDPRTAQGFVVDLRTGRLEAQGKLADEYMATIVSR